MGLLLFTCNNTNINILKLLNDKCQKKKKTL